MAEAGPLSSQDMVLLESSLLPSLERHHLRLLAHSLRTLQQIAGPSQGEIPSGPQLESWLAEQPQLKAEPVFQQDFRRQLEKAARQLEGIAASLGKGALTLDLSDLCRWADAQARTRLTPPG
ncbi:hypothetical protein KQ306_10770 [Synechococcus sp. CS-1324]|uniref:hypothetical protein n=1 Tax=Synechococcus sp. CS-1324 TaxID=2847980 RepID=UPI000DB2636F|nr:hypothetical protein [Synechococcus sp. CS-1324]MCT0231330.1 hypothetical protein [Synechococcus sp. CS-1324]PZV04703.1 MAG: hypothetical protein DCF23_05660 [Cyanobium sp.]